MVKLAERDEMRQWRFFVNHLLNRGKVASLRHQIDSVSKVCQCSNPKVLEHYLCLFSLSTQLVRGCFSHPSIVKLAEGDEMRQLHIEVHNVPAYCMNIKECMNIEAKIDGKPWYHDIKAYIKDGEYLLGPQTVRRNSSGTWHASFS